MSKDNQSRQIESILTLLHDPTFIRFDLKQRAPSIFNAVGRTHTETWHSALLGWLLNPNSSHGLGTFPLSKFILLLKITDNFTTEQRGIDLRSLLALGDLSVARVRPNEQELQEASTKESGRFDVFVDNIKFPPLEEVQILIEMKVKSKINISQCNKYIAFVEEKKKENKLVLPVFVAPTGSLIGSAKKLLGNETWLKVDFQSLYDDIIEPSLQHPQISNFGQYTLREYVKTLKFRPTGEEPMATSQEEKRMVEELLSKHAKAIRALYEIISEQDESIRPSVAGSDKRAHGEIRLKIGKKNFEASSVSKLYAKVLKYLYENKYLDNLQLPLATGSRRYLLATEPVHPEGNPFRIPIEYKGFYLEAHKARDVALHDLEGLIEKCDLAFEVLQS